MLEKYHRVGTFCSSAHPGSGGQYSIAEDLDCGGAFKFSLHYYPMSTSSPLSITMTLIPIFDVKGLRTSIKLMVLGRVFVSPKIWNRCTSPTTLSLTTRLVLYCVVCDSQWIDCARQDRKDNRGSQK